MSYELKELNKKLNFWLLLKRDHDREKYYLLLETRINNPHLLGQQTINNYNFE